MDVNAVRGRSSENNLTRKIYTRNISNAKYSRITVFIARLFCTASDIKSVVYLLLYYFPSFSSSLPHLDTLKLPCPLWMLSPSSRSPSNANTGFNILSTSAGCSSTDGGDVWRGGGSVGAWSDLVTSLQIHVHYKLGTCTQPTMCTTSSYRLYTTTLCAECIYSTYNWYGLHVNVYYIHRM